MQTKVLLNDRIVEMNQATVSILDRGYQFGDGVYEVIRFYDGVFFELTPHLERFKKSCEEIGIPFTYDFNTLQKNMSTLVKSAEFSSGYIYVQITRGTMQRNHLYLNEINLEPQLVAYSVKQEQRPFEDMKNGIKVLLCEDIRWLRCDIKSLNLLGSVMLKNQAASLGAKEAVLHRNGYITEGSATNVFIVKNGKLLTHPANNLILNGITRQVITSLAIGLEIEVVEEAFTIDEFRLADEAFTCATVSEICPIVSFIENNNETIIGNGQRGPITEKIQHAYTQKIKFNTDVFKLNR
jgi:D-alanine transaminase